MADATKLLRALLSGVYKKADTEIDAILADDTDDTKGETTVKEWDKARVAELQKPKTGSTFQDGYAKAKKEEREKFEAEIREKFGIDTDKNGIELIEALVAEKSGAAGGGGDLNEEKVEAHPLYQQLEKSKKTELKAAAD